LRQRSIVAVPAALRIVGKRMKFAGALKKFKLVVAGGLARLLASFGTVIVSLVIVRIQSPALWGQVVAYVILIDLGFSIVGWGATPYLVREFSLFPKNRIAAWSRATASRSLLLVALLLFIALFPAAGTLRLTLIVWAVARFIYQSFEPVVQFDRPFVFSLLVELGAICVILVPALLLRGQLTVQIVVALFALGMVLRALASAWRFRSTIRWAQPSRQFFLDAWPFLLLMFSAMLQQRADLYNVALFLNHGDVGTYQVFSSLLLFCHFLASMLLSPFAKNIFRLPERTFVKLERRFMSSGTVLSGLSIAAVYGVVHYLYRLDVPTGMYLWGYFYILIYYLYALRNYAFGKAGKQVQVSLFTLAGSVANLSLGALMTPRFGLEGALAAATLSQCLVLSLYHLRRVGTHAAN